jgi:molecular chaperone DnaK
MLRDSGDKISADTKKAVQDKIEALKKVKDTDNIEDVKAKTEELSQAVQKAGAEFYQKNQPQPGPQSGQESAGGQENKQSGPEDADFKEK